MLFRSLNVTNFFASGERTIKQIVFLAMGFLVLISCSLDVGESPRPPSRAVSQEIACIKGLGEELEKYLNSELSENEIRDWSKCLSLAIANFELYTKGEHSEFYSVEEVTQSIRDVVFPDKPITTNLISSLMELKSFFIGGSGTHVTRSELIKIRGLIDLIGEEAVKVNPYIRVLTSKKTEVPSERDLEIATGQLYQSLREILEYSPAGNRRLSSEKIYRAAVEIEKLESKMEDKVSRFLPLLISLYNTVSAEPEDNTVIDRNRADLFLYELTYWYRLRLVYNYQISHLSILQGEGLGSVKYLVDAILLGLKRVVNRYDELYEGNIGYTQVENLINGFGMAGLLPQPFSSKSLVELVRPLIDKIWGDIGVDFHRRANNGIDREVIAKVETEFYRWYEVQSYLERYFKDEFASISFDKVSLKSKSQWNHFLDRIPMTASHFHEMKIMWEKTPLVYQWGNPRLVLANTQERKKINDGKNFYELSLQNMIGTVVRLVARGYAWDFQRAQKLSGLTQEELDRFVNDFRLLWLDLNIMPPDSLDVGKKLFVEGNLFTLSGNGIQEPDDKDPDKHLLTFQEGVELVALLYSSATINKEVYEKYADLCLMGPKDEFNRKMMVETCFIQNFTKFYIPQFSGVPGVSHFLSSLHPSSTRADKVKEWADFESSISKLIRHDWEPKGWYGYIHLGKATVLLHYLESTLHKFDKDENGYIDEREGLEAYPHFRGLLKMMAEERCKNLTEDQLKTVYAFIFKYAKIPTGSIGDVWDEIWTTEAEKIDHLQMLKIFRQILSGSHHDNNEECVKPSEDDELGRIMEKAEDKSSKVESAIRRQINKF